MLAAKIQPQDSYVRHTCNHKARDNPNQRPILWSAPLSPDRLSNVN